MRFFHRRLPREPGDVLAAPVERLPDVLLWKVSRTRSIGEAAVAVDAALLSISSRTSTSKEGTCVPGTRQEAYAWSIAASSSRMACTSRCWNAFLTRETRLRSSFLTCSRIIAGCFFDDTSSKSRSRGDGALPSERCRTSSLVEAETT